MNNPRRLMRPVRCRQERAPQTLWFSSVSATSTEMFFEDAHRRRPRETANYPHLAKQKKKGEKIPMCGIPLPRRRGLHRQAHSQGLQGRSVRTNGRPKTDEKHLSGAKVTPRHHPWDGGRNRGSCRKESNFLAGRNRERRRGRGLPHWNFPPANFRATEFRGDGRSPASDRRNAASYGRKKCYSRVRCPCSPAGGGEHPC